MSELTNRIAEVLQNHPIQDGGISCGCGEWRAWTPEGSPNGLYEEHAAAAVADALQLTEEVAYRHGKSAADGDVPERRWVSPWSVEEQP